MRFVFGVLILFAVSFGGVFWYQTNYKASAPVEFSDLLKQQPAEYQRVHEAFLRLEAKEAEELERALFAFDGHGNKNALRQDVGGLVYRTLDQRQDLLNSAGLPWLERITRETVDLMHRYSAYGEAFCSYSIRRDHFNAERLLAENRREQETAELIEEFKQARFELVVLMLEALVDAKSNPVPVPESHQADLQSILIASASAEDADIIRRIKASAWTCREAFAVLETALTIKNDGQRYLTLAEMRTNI